MLKYLLTSLLILSFYISEGQCKYGWYQFEMDFEEEISVDSIPTANNHFLKKTLDSIIVDLSLDDKKKVKIYNLHGKQLTRTDALRIPYENDSLKIQQFSYKIGIDRGIEAEEGEYYFLYNIELGIIEEDFKSSEDARDTWHQWLTSNSCKNEKTMQKIQAVISYIKNNDLLWHN